MNQRRCRFAYAETISALLAVIFAVAPVFAQQSTTGPKPPPGIDRGLAPPVRGTVVLDVTAYLWHHGCGPTAAGMVMGYWSMNGYEQLVKYGVPAMIAGDHGDSVCGAPIGDHYHDYSCPIDGGSPIPDMSELGGAHTSDCIADFMRTSWSAAYNLYGWSWFVDVGQALLAYPPYADPTYTHFRMRELDFSSVSFTDYKAEIDAGRPTVFLVDTDGNGVTDHFVTGIGYSEDPPKYGVHDTWDQSIHWYLWRAIAPGVSWGIYGMHFFGPAVSFSAAPRFGDISLEVQFTGQSFDPPDSWQWDFGDGQSSSVRSPSHQFTAPGIYDVSLTATFAGEPISSLREDFIIALADSLAGQDQLVEGGSEVEVVISASNTVPLKEILIPLSYAGTLDLTLVSFSTAGCRTDYFESTGYFDFAPGRDQATIYLISSTAGTSPELAGGSGPVVRLTFSTGSAGPGDSAVISMSGYSTYSPRFSGSLLAYTPKTLSPVLRYAECCVGERGDVDGDGSVKISDVTALVSYFFRDGEPPACNDEADSDGSGVLNIADLTYLIGYLFRGGPVPALCPR